MITVSVSENDLRQLRFAYSPLVELSLSYGFLRSIVEGNEDYGTVVGAVYLRRRWLEDAIPMMQRLHLPYLDATILPWHYVADFMTPTPRRIVMRIENCLQELLNTPHDIIRRNMEQLIDLAGESEARLHLLHDPATALPLLVEQAYEYWTAVVAPHWTALARILEKDVMHRARQMVLEGVTPTVGNLDTGMILAKDYLLLERPTEADVTLRGEGIQFVPSAFSWCKSTSFALMWQINDDWHPMVIYQARGIGNLVPADKPKIGEALELTLGAAKARILQALDAPSSTGELADRLYVTPGSISQQMRRLSQAGLVESDRNGSRVYHRRTARGDDLLRVFETVG